MMTQQSATAAVTAKSASPLHVAVIMDGNGRWAQQRGLPRPVGHRKGAEQVRTIVEALPGMGVSHFTVYAFSTENWKRSTSEVLALMNLFERYIRHEANRLHQAGVKVRFIGNRLSLSTKLQNLMASLEQLTADNRKLIFNIAINYGGRDELVRVTKAVVAAVQSNTINSDEIAETTLSNSMDLAGQPDPDLIIRTGGQVRISNFLLWHAAYAEYVFSPSLWPDFTPAELANLIRDFQARTRKFGAA